MSGIPKKYCIFGCDSLSIQNVPLHRFPNPQKRFELFTSWVSAVRENLSEHNPEKIYKNKRICDHHFDPKFKTTGGRLIWSAVPTILERVQRSLAILVDIEHDYCRPRREIMHSTPLMDVTNMHTGNVDSNAGPSRPSHPSPSTLRNISNASITKLDTDVQQSLQLEDTSSLALPGPSTSREMCNPKVLQTKFDSGKTLEFIQKQSHKKYKRKERQMQNEIRRLRLKIKAIKMRLMENEKSSVRRDFNKLMNKMTESAKMFTRMQFEEGPKKKKGHRFRLNEKILCLSLFKKSPKAYKLMCKHFTLPSQKVLKSLLSQVKLSPGINDQIFKELKVSVEKMLHQDRLCTLIFDEMSIAPHIHYNVYTDDLVGFENYGNQKTEKFANHVLVFMVKGIKKNFKQPVAYYFTQTLQSTKLKEFIKEVVIKVQATGLKIIATVCDQSTVNVSAINSLISEAKSTYFQAEKEWRNDVIIIDSTKIIPLFDVPHLIKGIRNNLINKNMQYEHERQIRLIKWEYFQMVYEADRSHGELRLLPKLTNEHVDPGKIKKMRVKNAVQLLSHSLAVAVDNLVARGEIPTECQDLIPFTLLMDKLFDSLNCSSFSPPHGKIYGAAVRRKSPHHKLWQEALIMLKSVKFLTKKGDGETVEKSVPSVNNILRTIEGFKSIWQLLSMKYSFDSMLTRNFNQDPLENFFGSIRSLGARNVAPNCVGFEGAFKTLLLNNYSSDHAINSNCEEDTNKCLKSLKFFIKNKNMSNAPSQSLNIVLDHALNAIQNTNSNSDSGADQRAYVCGKENISVINKTDRAIIEVLCYKIHPDPRKYNFVLKRRINCILYRNFLPALRSFPEPKPARKTLRDTYLAFISLRDCSSRYPEPENQSITQVIIQEHSSPYGVVLQRPYRIGMFLAAVAFLSVAHATFVLADAKSPQLSPRITRKTTAALTMAELELNILFKFVKSYDGSRETLNSFLVNCDNAFSLASDAQKPILLKFILSQLHGKAEIACFIKEFTSWEQLKDFLKTQFSDKKHYSHLLTELQENRQGPQDSVSQYALRTDTCLSQLLTEISLSNTKAKELVGRTAAMEDLALHHFVMGLHPRISNIIRCKSPKSLNEAINYAISEERIQQTLYRRPQQDQKPNNNNTNKFRAGPPKPNFNSSLNSQRPSNPTSQGAHNGPHGYQPQISALSSKFRDHTGNQPQLSALSPKFRDHTGNQPQISAIFSKSRDHTGNQPQISALSPKSRHHTGNQPQISALSSKFRDHAGNQPQISALFSKSRDHTGNQPQISALSPKSNQTNRQGNQPKPNHIMQPNSNNSTKSNPKVSILSEEISKVYEVNIDTTKRLLPHVLMDSQA
ncbi:hypothetical protein evm_007081 [Chilo suppressalis]|nr:hypothetical protein evm_007081 [Chilo suppressalis]